MLKCRDSNYNIGDNLKEGILLSYAKATSLNWQGYSLDGGTNKTILGNTTIPLPDYGEHSIQVFGIDAVGNIHKSEIIFFTVSVDSSPEPPNPLPTNPFYFNLIFASTLSVIIGIASLMFIVLLITRRRRTIKITPKAEPPIKANVEAVFTCPYCHTEIGPMSNYRPYCSSKIDR